MAKASRPSTRLNNQITAEEVTSRLASYDVLPQIQRDSIIDEAIAPFTCTPKEIADACQQFYQRCNLTSESERRIWLRRFGMSPEHLEAITQRRLRVEKFKQATWGDKLERYFRRRKGQLAQVIYSLIQVEDQALAQELYHRIQVGQAFTELAQEYSQGREAQTGGVVGPVALSALHPTLARVLRSSQPGELLAPIPLGEWLLVVRLEKLIPVQLNEFMRRQLLRELFEAWVRSQVNQLPD